MAKKKKEQEKKGEVGLPPFPLPDKNRLVVEVGCYVCNNRAFVRIDPFAGGNQYACEKCGAQNLVLLRPYTVAYVRAVAE